MNGKLILTKYLEIYIIEVSKYKKSNKNNIELDNWIEFLENPGEMEESKMSEEIKKAKECLEKISKDKHEQRLAELRDRYVRETKTAQEEGDEKARKEIAKKMLQKGMNIKDIEELTGLSKTEIKQ